MKKSKLAGIALSLLLVIVVGSVLAQSPSRFRLTSDPINRFILNESSGPWGTRLSLIPKPFAPGISIADVDRQLKDAGYTLTRDGQLPGFNVVDEIDQGRIVYSRRADNFVCNKVIFISVAYDDNEQLIHAQSAMYEVGCL